MAGHGLQDMDCWTRIAGHGHRHGSQDIDTYMDCRTRTQTWIAGHGYGHGWQNMDGRTWMAEHGWQNMDTKMDMDMDRDTEMDTDMDTDMQRRE